ncbi:MAG: CaiB/BaiF CoA-transferase family protein [Pseudomonadales bacterium]|nr:CaiB/BaiF CoA-transferase family protein [Pseudomonadales bacterium]
MKLDGIRVLDLSLFLPGPTATLMMADHGAEVIKIEALGEGEPNRHIGQRRDGVSVYFDNTHRGKKSLTLNLKAPAGHALFMRLAETADVIVEAFRPGVVRRLGIDYAAVRARNPRIVYASISAFGQTGPLVDRPAHDLAVEAMCGLLSNNVDREGRPTLPAMPSGDMLAATLALAGISMALFRRERTGRGDYLDLAMMDAILACMPNSMGAAFAEKRSPEPTEERIWGGHAFYRIYPCADGEYLVLGGVEMKFVRALLGALGREDLAPLCATPGAVQAPVVSFLEETFASQPRAHWIELLSGLDLCWAPVNDLRTGLDLEQTRARGMVLTDADGREYLGAPLKFEEEPPAPGLVSPAHGRDTDALLGALGLAPAEIADLRAQGVV